MAIATVRETANFTNNTNAVSPYTLGQVLAAYATEAWVTEAIAHASIDPSQIDLRAYAKKTDLPTKLSQLTNDANYVQTVSGLIPSNLLPSYVDDVIEVANYSSLPAVGESGKIYVTLDTNLTYRWGGSEYVEISKSLALGTTSTTAFRGDYGNVAYQHSQSTGNPHNTTLSDFSITVTPAEINYLAGLDKNILDKFAEKLSLTGGTMSGYITLHHDPTQKMHAANKDYVDKEINGISVTVTQNVTQISNLSQGLEGLTSTVGAQADTLVEVNNSLTTLNQTTQTHTSAISEINQNLDGIGLSVSNISQTTSNLEASVNQLNCKFDTETLFIQVDEDRYPMETNDYTVEYQCFFRGNEVDPDSVILTGSNVGITADSSVDNEITFSVATDTAIPLNDNVYTLSVAYESGNFTWHYSKTIHVIVMQKGDTGDPGDPGEQGPQGKSVIGFEEQYYKSTSSSEQTGGMWTAVYPGWTQDYYIWTKTVTYFSDGTSDDTTPILATDPETGRTSIDGTGVTRVDALYYYSTSNQTPTGGSWDTEVPTYERDKFLWTKTRTYYSTGFSEETEPICVTGDKGDDAIVLEVTSSNGLIFKSNMSTTILQVAVYCGGHRITNITDLHSYINVGAYLQWKWKRIQDQDYGVISSSDSRLSNDGFTLTLSPSDIDEQVTFICELIQ